MKKIIYILLSLGLILCAYLYLANAYIYYRIGQGHLKVLDFKDSYMLNSPTPTTTNLIYVALGDSLTAGAGVERVEDSWPYIVAAQMSTANKNIKLKNLSQLGATTGDVINKLVAPALAAKPDIITLLIGVNDIHDRIKMADFKQHYDEILRLLKQGTKAQIYVISIPYIGSDTLILPPYNQLFETETIKYNEIIKELANNYGVRYIDITTPTMSLFKTNGPYYSVDSFHPSASGYKIWADIIYDHINH